MRLIEHIPLLLLGLLCGCAPALSEEPVSEEPVSEEPVDVLWAWERPEDLRFLDARTAVAPLVATLDLIGDRVRVRGRRQPLRTTEGAPLIAVVRIESSRRSPPALSPEQRDAAVDAILAVFPRAAEALQIDFDAVLSERDFYGDLLRALRARLPPPAELTITALVSWCLDDRWLADLPIDDAVPMLFRMGRDAEALRALLDQGDLREPRCRRSFGLSTDEPWPRLVDRAPERRRYIFHPEPWTARAFAEFRR